MRALALASPKMAAFVVAVLSWAVGIVVSEVTGMFVLAPFIAAVPVALAGWRGADSRAPAPARELTRWVQVWYAALGLVYIIAVLSALLVAVASGWRP